MKQKSLLKKPLSQIKLGFIQSYSGASADIIVFVQLIPGSYKGDKPINITGVNEIHLKRDCIAGSTVNGVREIVQFSFALD